MTMEKKMEDRRKKILRFDRWVCKLCDANIDAFSKVDSEDGKAQFLIDHIKQRHKDSPDVDIDMKERFLPLYFAPFQGDKVQKNEKSL